MKNNKYYYHKFCDKLNKNFPKWLVNIKNNTKNLPDWMIYMRNDNYYYYKLDDKILPYWLVNIKEIKNID